MAKSADPDQLASSEAKWSGSTLFAKAGFIWVQQDKGQADKQAWEKSTDEDKLLKEHFDQVLYCLQFRQAFSDTSGSHMYLFKDKTSTCTVKSTGSQRICLKRISW